MCSRFLVHKPAIKAQQFVSRVSSAGSVVTEAAHLQTFRSSDPQTFRLTASLLGGAGSSMVRPSTGEEDRNISWSSKHATFHTHTPAASTTEHTVRDGGIRGVGGKLGGGGWPPGWMSKSELITSASASSFWLTDTIRFNCGRMKDAPDFVLSETRKHLNLNLNPNPKLNPPGGDTSPPAAQISLQMVDMDHCDSPAGSFLQT